MKSFKVPTFIVLLTVLLLEVCNDLEDYEDDLLENHADELNGDVSNLVLEEDDVELIFRHMYIPEPYGDQKSREMVDHIEGKTDVKVTLDEGTRDGYEVMLSSEATRNELPHIIQMYTPSTFLYDIPNISWI